MVHFSIPILDIVEVVDGETYHISVYKSKVYLQRNPAGFNDFEVEKLGFTVVATNEEYHFFWKYFMLVYSLIIYVFNCIHIPRSDNKMG